MTKLPNIRKKVTVSLIIASILFSIVVLLLIYSSFIYFAPCKDEACFFAHLKNCDRASYSKTSDYSVFYNIEGYNFNRCQVRVSIKDAQNNIGLEDIYKDTSMTCGLKFGLASYPEYNLESCTGMLKEGLQEVLINRLKVEIARNIGEIKLDIFSGS